MQKPVSTFPIITVSKLLKTNKKIDSGTDEIFIGSNIKKLGGFDTMCYSRLFFNTIVHSPIWYQLIQYKSVNTSAQDENTTSYYIRKEKKKTHVF